MDFQDIKEARKIVYAHTKGINGSFANALMNCWDKADIDNQRALSIGFPQMAQAIKEWQWSGSAEAFHDKFIKGKE